MIIYTLMNYSVSAMTSTPSYSLTSKLKLPTPQSTCFHNSRSLFSFDTRGSLTPTILHKLWLSLDLLVSFSPNHSIQSVFMNSRYMIQLPCIQIPCTYIHIDKKLYLVMYMKLHICLEACSWSMNTLKTGFLHSMQMNQISPIQTAKFQTYTHRRCIVLLIGWSWIYFQMFPINSEIYLLPSLNSNSKKSHHWIHLHQSQCETSLPGIFILHSSQSYRSHS